MSNIISIIIGLILIVGTGGIVVWQTQDKALEPVQTTESTGGETGTTLAPRGSSDDDDDEEEIEFEDGTVPSGAGAAGGGSTGSAGGASTGITAAVVAQHSSRSSCWSSINGSVYDLTSWIPKHPGGEQAILQLCGTDGSAKFNGQHGGDSSKQAILTGFKVGVLAQ